MDNVTVILRECGERTANLAFESLEAMISTDRLFRINEIPFSRAVQKSFEIGIREARKWTLCIDADVLVNPTGVRSLITEAEGLSEDVFETQGFVFDKFFCIHRPAGNHLYRSKLLAPALKLIPFDESSVRPESDTVNAMKASGFPWFQSLHVVGAHDFYQSYADIYRKCFLQAFKHREYMEFPKRYWEVMSKTDAEFRVALAGLSDGAGSTQPEVSKEFMSPRKIADRIESLDLGIQGPPPSNVEVDSIVADLQSSLPRALGRQRNAFESMMLRLFVSESRASAFLSSKSRMKRVREAVGRVSQRLSRVLLKK